MNGSVTHAKAASAPTENFKENWEVPHVEHEPNGCCRVNSNVLALVRVHRRGQESISQAVREGGLMSIRDNEAEGECQHIPTYFVDFSVRFSLCQLSVALSLFSLCLRTLLRSICSHQCDN